MAVKYIYVIEGNHKSSCLTDSEDGMAVRGCMLDVKCGIAAKCICMRGKRGKG